MKKLLSLLLVLLLVVGCVTSVDARRGYITPPSHIYEFVESNGYTIVRNFVSGYVPREQTYSIVNKKIKAKTLTGEFRGLADAYNAIKKSSSSAEFKTAVKKDIDKFENLYGEFVDYTTNKQVFIEAFATYCLDKEMLRQECKNLYNYIKTNVFEFNFKDIKETDWYRDWTEEAYCLGLMTGATETLFKPNSKMTRGMVATVLHRMEGSTYMDYFPFFSDLKNNQYYTIPVIWCYSTGIINGYKDGTFKPTKNVTREEMATMLYNFAKYKKSDLYSDINMSYFKDYNKVSSYAKTPMRWCYVNCIIEGKDNYTRLDPQGYATRAECAKMLVLAYDAIY